MHKISSLIKYHHIGAYQFAANQINKKYLHLSTMLTSLKQPASNGVEKVSIVPSKKGKNKLEDIYQKKTQLEHILLRPDTYIGSVEKVTEPMWLYDGEKEAMVHREITYVPGLYKIFDEILVNAADHKTKNSNMDSIRINIDQANGSITIWNNGSGIPVAMHATERMYVPTMIFGHLLTSSNYDDEEQKVTGGRNGFGAKLCNIFSNKFTVETCSKEYKKSFKQSWGSNMSKAGDPKIKEFIGGNEFTKITFCPDLTKFKMDTLDDDITAIMTRRAYDVAAGVKGIKVFLNDKRIPVKNFKDYVDLFIKGKVDDAGNPIKCVYECLSQHWEVAIATSDKGFQHMSFVNSIATTKGGRHVDHIADMITKKLAETLKKKNKSGVDIKPFQIKNHMWLFINCQVHNPTFDSQTKENLTLQVKSFGTKCTLTDKFITGISKCGIVESCLVWAKFKEQSKLQAKCSKQKQSKVKGVPKLEDANDAGTRHSIDCTLILTEGDSAKTLAVAGLGVIGRDRFGVFPLKGKLLNVREASSKQILENAEINNVIKIVGLQYNKKYASPDDLKSLRYGKLMIMTDQDQDGSHIKGLIINFIHHNWPALLKLNFLEEFITPIVKTTKGKEILSFYSMPEFEEWKANTSNWHTYKIKYYKGLGTSTSVEAKEYFNNMTRHKIKFYHDGPQDDHSINLAFSKKAVDDRKEWLGSWMTECKRRKELGLPEIYLYEKDTHRINYSDFVNKELVIFSNLDNERSIPSLVDGLKPGQRKVMFTCFKRNDKKEIKVAQLSGSVAEQSCYHHGEASLMSTIINLAHNFVGSNNINLLKPIGQFGTRLMGGKDAASPRYIFTQLSPLAKHIFHPDDDPLLNFLTDDNQKIEPDWYIPIIPMILVNGSDGIGTGWSTKIPNFNPREIIANIRRLLKDEEPVTMIPWFKNFKGLIEPIDYQKYVVHGEISRLGGNKFQIDELPVRVWTTSYKESVLEPFTTGNEKTAPILNDMRDYNTDTTIKMIVTVQPNAMNKVEEAGPHKLFKLQTTITTSSMVLFDKNGVIKTYSDSLEILHEFYQLRLVYYVKRKDYILGMLEAEACKLSNQARFIVEKCSGQLTIENKKKKDMILEMQRKGFDSDPVKEWKKIAHKGEVEDGNEFDEDVADGSDFDYLLGMPMWNLTKEKKEDILKKKDDKNQELEAIKKKTPKDLWNDDLNKLLEELDRVEQQERDEEAAVPKSKGKKAVTKKKVIDDYDFGFGERIIPQIDAELKRKVEKAAQLKEGRNKKAKKEPIAVERDEFDDIATVGKSLAARLGNSPDLVEKKANKIKKEMSNEVKSKKKRIVIENSDVSVSGSGSDMEDIKIVPRERVGGRRTAASKVKYNFSEEEVSASDSDLSMHSNEGVCEDGIIQEHVSFNDSSILQARKNPVNPYDSEDSEDSLPPKKSTLLSFTGRQQKKNPVNRYDSEDSNRYDSEDSEDSFPPKKSPPKKSTKKQSNEKKKPVEKYINVSDTDSEFDDKSPNKVSDQPSASEMFDCLVGSSPVASAPAKKTTKRPKQISDSDSDSPPAKKKVKSYATKPTQKKAKPKPKKAGFGSDSDDFFMEEDNEKPTEKIPLRETARGKKTVKKYTFADSDDSASDF